MEVTLIQLVARKSVATLSAFEVQSACHEFPVDDGPF